VSSITDKVLDKAREWQSRPLESIYALIYMDAVFLKMRHEDHVRNMAVYTIVGINKQVYLAIEGASKKWIFRHREWPVIYSQLMIYFGDHLTEQT
jgi:transposase-like protein